MEGDIFTYKRKIITCLVLTLVFSLGFSRLPALADTVYLKHGGILEGVIIQETDEAIMLKLNIGVATILRNDIENIEKSLKEENEELEDKWRDVSEEIKKETDETKKEFNLIKSKETKVSEDEEIKSTQTEEIPKPSESPKKESPLGPIPKISIKDRRIYVNDSLYYIKGVAYGINYPECPGGMRGYEKISLSIFKKDFKMMEEAGVNTIRTYEPIPDELLDLAYKHNIMVIENIVYPHSATLFDSDEELANLIDKAKEVVKDGKDHPAILMWSIWNDAPFTWGRKGNAVKRFGFEKVNNFLKEIYLAVKSEDAHHPITGSNMLNQEGSELGFDFLDVIGTNAYVGGHGRWQGEEKAKKTVEELVDYSLKYNKPVVILETGYSTYIINELRSESQEEVLRSQIKVTGENIAGLVVFQWSDGWWKAGRPEYHDINIEEHWGIVTGYREPKSGLRAVSELFNSIPTESKGYKE